MRFLSFLMLSAGIGPMTPVALAQRQTAPTAVPYAREPQAVDPGWYDRLLKAERWPAEDETGVAAANRLASLLWEDFGDPELNYWNQFITLMVISGLGPRFEPDARRVLQQRLLDFWEAGGFQIATNAPSALSYPMALSAVVQVPDERTERVLLDATETLAAAALRPLDADPAAANELPPAWELAAWYSALTDLADETAGRVCKLLGLAAGSSECRLVRDLYTQATWNEAERYLEQTFERMLSGEAEGRETGGAPRAGRPATASAPAADAFLRAELRKLLRERGDAARVRRVAGLALHRAGRERDWASLRRVLRCYQRLAAHRATPQAVVEEIDRQLVRLMSRALESRRLMQVWMQTCRVLPPRAGRAVLEALGRRKDARAGGSSPLRALQEQLAQKLHQRGEPSSERTP